MATRQQIDKIKHDIGKDLITGLGRVGHSVVYKSAKEGQKSFRITSNMLQSLWSKSDRINNKGKLVLNIPANKTEDYILECYLTKKKK